MRRVGLVLWLALVLVVSMHWVGQANQAAAQGAPGANPARFTGKSTVMEGKELTAARRSFEAGARTFWHSHDKGQLLLVEEGRMRTQKRGEKVRELGVGQSEYAGPNVVHWHGATSSQALVQINVGFGGETKWLEEVSAADYNKK